MQKSPESGRLTVYDTYDDALSAARQVVNRSDSAINRPLTRVLRSPYGEGFIVRTFPATFMRNARLRERVRTLARDACYGDL